jgi:cytochrome b involved in lipid metabolism
LSNRQPKRNIFVSADTSFFPPFEKASSSSCFHELNPCAECSTGNPCPLLPKQPGPLHATLLTRSSSPEKRRRGDPCRSYIWRSISRRLLFNAADAAKDAAAAAKEELPQTPMVTGWQVRRHRVGEDCWLVAHGVVYDVSLFIKRHPGGERALLRRAGRDCSEDLDFHTAAARQLWRSYRIGVLTTPHPPLDP